MIRLIAGIVGALLIAAVWLSVMRTVVTPGQRSSLLTRCSVRLAVLGGYALGRWLPQVTRLRFLELVPAFLMFAVGGCWVVGMGGGFLLLGYAAHETAPGEFADLFLMRSGDTPIAAIGWLCAALLLAAFTTYLVRFVGAYSQRETQVARLVDLAIRPPDAERVLARYLQSGSRDGLDRLFSDWVGWTTDVRCTHTAYPALVFARPSSDVCWISAITVLCDGAALACAIAPTWAPPAARELVDAGIRCLHELSGRIGAVPVSTPVSLEGREECAFSDTVRLTVEAGLPMERDMTLAWQEFQRLRIQYAPYAAAMADRLHYRHRILESDAEILPDVEVGR